MNGEGILIPLTAGFKTIATTAKAMDTASGLAFILVQINFNGQVFKINYKSKKNWFLQKDVA